MSRRLIPLLSALLSAVVSGPVWSGGGSLDPLFASETTLDITLQGPIREIIFDRRKEPEDRPGKLGFTDAAGSETWFDVGIRSRGKSRRIRTNCRFPPLRVNFKKEQTGQSVFANQDKLKLVTHCKTSARFEQYLLLEYLIYKTLNLLTEESFKARLVKIRYLDDGDKDFGTHPGFFIEHKDKLAKRVHQPVAEPDTITAAELEPELTSTVELFQYMIGNTDFSMLRGPEGEVCCHNLVLFGALGGPYHPVPYDFDSTGLVNPPHASPNEMLKLRSVTKRLYRGFCRSERYLADALDRIASNKTAIYELFGESHGLTRQTRKRVHGYLDDFYEIIESPKQRHRRFVKNCRPVAARPRPVS